MKRFRFRLQAALDWRERQRDLEQARLQALLQERRAADAAILHLDDDASEAQEAVFASKCIDARSLAALEVHRAHIRSEQLRALERREECDGKILSQRKVLTESERAVRLLGKLKERRLADWTAEVNKEAEALAGESFLARWLAGRRSSG